MYNNNINYKSSHRGFDVKILSDFSCSRQEYGKSCLGNEVPAELNQILIALQIIVSPFSGVIITTQDIFEY